MVLNCPRCVGKLEEIEVNGVILDRCDVCAGVWFDHGEISEIIGERISAMNVEEEVPSATLAEKKMSCPRCEGVALRKLVVDASDKDSKKVHRCVSCSGTWLDRGQLRKQEDPQLKDAILGFFEKIEIVD